MNKIFSYGLPLAVQMQQLVIDLRAAGRPHIALVACDDPILKREAMAELGERLSGKYEFYEFDYSKTDQLSLPRFCRALRGDLPACVFAYGLEELADNNESKEKYDSAVALLNNHREDIRDTNTAVVLWLTAETRKDILRRAPDFADWRTSSAEFALPGNMRVEITPLGKLSVVEAEKLRIQARRFEDMLSRPNLSPALGEEFYSRLTSARERLGVVKTEYDALLSYADEDVEFCNKLIERLKNENVRVWFDKERLRPGDSSPDKFNEGLERSRKMIAVWSAGYFRDDKARILAENFISRYSDSLFEERPLLPLLIEDCNIPSPFNDIPCIDYRLEQDRDLRFHQLIRALDMPMRDFADQDDPVQLNRLEELHAPESLKHPKRTIFEDEIKTLYELLGFETKREVYLGDVRFDLTIQQKFGGMIMQAVVECRNKRIAGDDLYQILARQNAAQKAFPKYRWIAVSSQGFAPEARTALDAAGVDCISYSELLNELLPLDKYVEGLISDYEDWKRENWEGEDRFIRPDLIPDGDDNKLPALDYIGKWLNDPKRNQLVVLGDLGAGKTTLARFLAYNLAEDYKRDPIRFPAPVLVPLKEVRKEVSLEGVIIEHFNRRGFSNVNARQFEHLVKIGKIILIFDAFDEMADRVHRDVTLKNFNELSRPAEMNGKVILTCRTHYFKDRKEQVTVIGEGPTLSETDTELLRNVKQRSGAEAVFLQEFDEEKIIDYLRKSRPNSFEEDWKKIEEIYNLKDLAHRPLLLEMIVQSFPSFNEGDEINAATLYSAYVNECHKREKEKGRLLDEFIKSGLLQEIAWKMLLEEKNVVHYRALAPFIQKLADDGVIDLEHEEPEDIAREIRIGSLLKRDDDGGLSFLHRSLMEYFIARKIQESVVNADSSNALEQILNVRRFEQKIVYFLALLDEQDQILQPLRKILTDDYCENVSENALQILYWSGRIRNNRDMKEEIDNLDDLRSALAQRLPAAMRFSGAKLQGMTLEAAVIDRADLSKADLTKANLNNACFIQADLSQAELKGASFVGTILNKCNFAGANYNEEDLLFANVENNIGISVRRIPPPNLLLPIVQLGHSGTVGAVAYSPNGELIAVGGGDYLIHIYRAEDGRLLHSLVGHQSWVNSVAFSADGNTLASGSYDRTVRLWNVRSGSLLRSLEGHKDAINSVAFSADGNTLASGSYDRTVKLWNVRSGSLLRSLEGHQNKINSVAFSPEGNTLASGSDHRTVKLWDVKNGSLIRSLEGHKSAAISVAFSADGNMLASGSRDRTVRLWDVRSGSLLRSLEGHKDAVNSVAFSPEGNTLASGSDDRTVKLWDVKNGSLLRSLEGDQYTINSVAFSPEGNTLASGGRDSTVRIWDVSSGFLLDSLKGHQGAVNSVAFSPEGNTLASGGRGRTVRLWNVKDGSLLRSLEGHKFAAASVAFSPDGNTLASGSSDKTVRLWNVKKGFLLRSLEGHKDAVNSVAFSADGNTLASGSDDRTVKLWDVKNGSLLRSLEGDQNTINSVAFSADGNTLASGSSDKTVRLWDVSSGSLLPSFEGHQDWVNSVAFSPDGNMLASGSRDSTVRLWDVRSGSPLRSLVGHKSAATSITFSPDGNTLASGSRDSTVRIWDVSSGSLLRSLEGHKSAVLSVAFSPDGRYLIAAGAAGRLQFWDWERGDVFLYLYGFGRKDWLALLPDGRFDGTPEGMNYLCYTEINTFNSYPAEMLVKEFHNPEAVKEAIARYVN